MAELIRWYVALLDDVRHPGAARSTTVSRGGYTVDATSKAAAIRAAKKKYPGHAYYQAQKYVSL